MLTLRPAAEIAAKVLKLQKPSDGTLYRPMTYCVLHTTSKGVLAYNVLTKSIISLSDNEAELLKRTTLYTEAEADDTLKQLIALRYLVPDEHDDYQLLIQLQQLAKMLGARKKTKNYTILTTTDCNARCFYCYELGRPRTPMNEQTAHEVAKYIAADKIKIQWFGGEPLYNLQAIDTICNDLKESGTDYSSQMTSNAYLFDTNIVQRAVDLWHLKQMQVTLDGTEEVYNRCKAFIYTEGSAYRRVIRNIGLLLDAGIKVNIRLNIDMHNAENLLQLVEELHVRFAEKKGLYVYSHTIFEETLGHARSEDRRKLLYDKQAVLDDRIRQLGFMARQKLSHEIKVNCCKVDSGNCEVILPDGHIGLCEHFTDDHFIGHISAPYRDEKSIREQREVLDETDCHTCPLLPNCIRLRICENNHRCYPEDRERKQQSIRNALLQWDN